METVFIDRRDAALDVDNRRLLIRLDDSENPVSVPLHQMKHLIINAPVTVTTSLMTQLSEAGVSMIFMNSRKPGQIAMTLPYQHGNATRRVLQYKMQLDYAACNLFAQQLIAYRIRQQQLLLKRLQRKRPVHRYSLTQVISRADNVLEKIHNTSPSNERLLGLEGSVSAAYFQVLGKCVPEDFMFTSRNRRPPRDPVNALLSLTYTILHQESVRALASFGLDPMLSFYHKLSYGRESLACDQVELMRTRADAFVLRLINTQQLKMQHFSIPGSADRACLLNKSGRAIYYRAFEKETKTWRKLLRKISGNWAARLEQSFSPDTSSPGQKNV